MSSRLVTARQTVWAFVMMAGLWTFAAPSGWTQEDEEELLPFEAVVPSDDQTSDTAPLAGHEPGELPSELELMPATAETGYESPNLWEGKLAVQAGLKPQTLAGEKNGVFAAAPAQGEPKAAILILHDWWGQTEPVRKEAWGWGTYGYDVMALDLYGGRTAQSKKEAARLMSLLDEEKTQKLVRAAAQELAGRGRPVFVFGYGMGGDWARRLVQSWPQAAGLGLFYGGITSKPAAVEGIKCPVLAIYAGRDGWVSPNKITRFEDNLSSQSVVVDSENYDTLPGFALAPQDDRERSYARLAHEKALKFLETNTPAPKKP